MARLLEVWNVACWRARDARRRKYCCVLKAAMAEVVRREEGVTSACRSSVERRAEAMFVVFLGTAVER